MKNGHSINRESLRRHALKVLQVLTAYHQEQGNYDQALAFAYKQVEFEPYQEAAHQQVMWLLALTGQRNEALEHYHRIRKLLKEELGIEPLEPTQAMHARIAQGEIPEAPTRTMIMRREPRIVGESPYRGLAAFREADAPFFFGREEFTNRLETAVRQSSMVAVIVGSSGTGKSSTVFAGLLPRLRDDGHWLISDFRPSEDPFRAMAQALLPLFEPKLEGPDLLPAIEQLANSLHQGEEPLFHLAERVLIGSRQANQLLVLVDQFEELYTLCPDPDLRRRFLEVLLTAVKEGKYSSISPFVLLLTLRADFMGQALTYRPFADALQENSLILGPMNQEELRAAIEKPAQKQGAAFEAGLVPRILNDVGQEPGNLPLLEFALTLLWERLDQGWLTHQAYETLGRVEGALARHAEEVIEQFTTKEHKLAQQVFIQLVQPGEGTEDTKRVAKRADLDDQGWSLVQRLASARLVVTSHSDAQGETVELVHEALISGWKRLRGWMEEDRAFRTWQEGLRAAIRGWESSDRDEGALLRGAPLAQAETWLAAKAQFISQLERSYIQESLDLRARKQTRRERRRRIVITALGVGLIFAILLTALTGTQWQRADIASALANSQRATAQADAAARATQQTLAEEQARLATARELAMASLNNLEVDPELSILLALQAAEETRLDDGIILPEAEDALHKAVQAARAPLTLPHGSGVAFSPNGQWLATAGPDATARSAGRNRRFPGDLPRT